MWSLNFITGLVTSGVLIAILTALVPVMYRKHARARYYDGDTFLWMARGLIASVVIVVAFTAGALFPWEKPYHYFETYSGPVAEIEARLLADGDGMSEKFAVRFEGSTQEYGCEDTRCALVQPGDTLTLRCIKVWEYSGTDGYDCSFVSATD